jgi:hypothetical protein
MEGPFVTAQDVQMQIPISVSWGDPKLEFRLRFPVFQPIDAPWVNNTGQEPNAGDEELTCSARKRRFVRHAGNRPSHGQGKNRSRRNNAVAGAHTKFKAEGQCRSAHVI